MKRITRSFVFITLLAALSANAFAADPRENALDQAAKKAETAELAELIRKHGPEEAARIRHEALRNLAKNNNGQGHGEHNHGQEKVRASEQLRREANLLPKPLRNDADIIKAIATKRGQGGAHPVTRNQKGGRGGRGAGGLMGSPPEVVARVAAIAIDLTAGAINGEIVVHGPVNEVVTGLGTKDGLHTPPSDSKYWPTGNRTVVGGIVSGYCCQCKRSLYRYRQFWTDQHISGPDHYSMVTRATPGDTESCTELEGKKVLGVQSDPNQYYWYTGCHVVETDIGCLVAPELPAAE